MCQSANYISAQISKSVFILCARVCVCVCVYRFFLSKYRSSASIGYSIHKLMVDDSCMFSVVVIVYIIDYISQSLSHFLVVGCLSFLLLIEQDQNG